MKLFHFPAAQPQAPDPLSLMLLVAAVMETVLGFLLVIGLFTRASAFMCSGLMAFAYFIAHAPRSFWPALNGGDDAVLFCFIFLFLAAAGGGILSVDSVLAKRRGSMTNFR